MLRNVFPDEPGDDECIEADNPGAFFAEFLPSDVRAAHAAARLASPDKAEQPDPSTIKQTQESLRQAVADAAAAAQASAEQASTAAAKAAQQAVDADLVAAAEAAAAVQSSSDDDFDLPSIGEIKGKLANAWFGDSDGSAEDKAQKAEGKKQRQRGDGSEEGGEDEGMLEKLLPFTKDKPIRTKAAEMMTSSKPGNRPKSKPMRLKLAEQVLSKEMLSAVQLIEDEILSSADPLPSATIKFFLRAGATMGQGWARDNLSRVFGFLSAYVAATCGVMHGIKAGIKWLAWRVPRIGKRVTGPAVSFTSDVLLPTTFFGPSLAAYILLLVICKKPQSEEDEAEAQEAEAGAATSPEQQGNTIQHSQSREVQVEFVVSPRSKRHKGQVRCRHAAGKIAARRGKAKQQAPATVTDRALEGIEVVEEPAATTLEEEEM